jgi:hypothetical protein
MMIAPYFKCAGCKISSAIEKGIKYKNQIVSLNKISNKNTMK